MRIRITITGAVQGVGFRPYVYRLACGYGLSGHVQNSVRGVRIEAQGEASQIASFEDRLRREPPANAVIRDFVSEAIPEQDSTGFSVRTSDASGEPDAYLLPDLAVCGDCLRDIQEPGNRRQGYAFTSCTNCGPRYSIVMGLPYDRSLTSMRRFALCEACSAEYHDPADRRFHAQTNACPACGPQLALWDSRGGVRGQAEEALTGAVEAIRAGRIVALKGLGGFHLICDARNREAIAVLRSRKHRPSKPFAVMAPSLEAARKLCRVEPAAERLLLSAQSPIALLERTGDCALPEEIAPRNPCIGMMLPYSPLHALLLDELQFPVVATSGNLSDEPICIDEMEALERLSHIADEFLVHDRPILRPIDDSVVRFIDGEAVLLRRARGYAPLPIPCKIELPEMLATGAHMKNTVAFSRGKLIFLSQHLGDLSTLAALESHSRCIDDMKSTYQLRLDAAACDLHPDYGSTRAANSMGLPVHAVQHHEAHVLAGVVEHGIDAPVLGVSWDGSGMGTDHTVWGGEFLLFDGRTFRRVAHLRPFRLPGGEQAVREPRRSLLGLLHEMGDTGRAEALFPASNYRVLREMLDRGVNSPQTTSAGRLFDGAAALLGICPVASFEGEAAAELEFAASQSKADDSVAITTDWAPLIHSLAEQRRPVADRARMFHNALAGMIVRVAEQAGAHRVMLTGGCFQNALLTELSAARLRAAGFEVFTHRLLPPNDGSISVGQLLGAALQRGI
jgi:hydrogenase maturation protein HypF